MPTLSSLYKFEVYGPTGALLFDLGGIARQRQMSVARNKTYQSTFTIDIPKFEEACIKSHIDPDTIIASGLNDIKIRRGNRYLMGGQMNIDDGTLDEDTADMAITVQGWLEYFAQRETDQLYSYTGIDFGAILWDQINNAQLQPNGNIGITEGTIETSAPFTKDYDSEKNIKDILTELTNAQNSPDMEFAPDKSFNVYYPMGAIRKDLAFIYPGNVKKLQVTRDATKIANWVLGKAAGLGAVSDASSITVQDATSQGIYKLRQVTKSFNDVYDSSVLSAFTNEILRTSKLPIELVQLTVDGNRKPFLGSYWLGDKVPLFVNSKFTTYNRLNGNYYRIDQLDLTIDENDSEEVVITAVRYQ